MYVFLSTLGSPEIRFLRLYCVLNRTQEYSWVLLCSKDLLEYIYKMSTQY